MTFVALTGPVRCLSLREKKESFEKQQLLL